MPIIKSAIKRMKQNEKRRINNRHYGSHMKSMIKLILGYVKEGKMDEAKKILPDVISAIDTAAKKKLVHENNAAHKKSRIQRAINAGPPKKENNKSAPKKAAKKPERVKEVEVWEEKVKSVEESISAEVSADKESKES